MSIIRRIAKRKKLVLYDTKQQHKKRSALLAMSCPTKIAQTKPLTSGNVADRRAAEIHEGEAFGGQVEAARLELSTRKRLRETNDALAEEVKESRRRLVAVETTEAHVSHGMGNAAVLLAIDDMKNQLKQMQASMANVRWNIPGHMRLGSKPPISQIPCRLCWH